MNLLPLKLRSWIFFTYLDRRSFLNAALVFGADEYHKNIVAGKLNNYKTAKYALKSKRFSHDVIYHKLCARGHENIANTVGKKYFLKHEQSVYGTIFSDIDRNGYLLGEINDYGHTITYNYTKKNDNKYLLYYLKYRKIKCTKLFNTENRGAFIDKTIKYDRLDIYQKFTIPINLEAIILHRSTKILDYVFNHLTFNSRTLALLLLNNQISGPVINRITYSDLEYVINIADHERIANLFIIPGAREIAYQLKSFDFLLKIKAPVEILFKKAVQEDYILIVEKLLKNPKKYEFPGCRSIRMYNILKNHYTINNSNLIDEAFAAGNIAFIKFLNN